MKNELRNLLWKFNILECTTNAYYIVWKGFYVIALFKTVSYPKINAYEKHPRTQASKWQLKRHANSKRNCFIWPHKEHIIWTEIWYASFVFMVHALNYFPRRMFQWFFNFTEKNCHTDDQIWWISRKSNFLSTN